MVHSRHFNFSIKITFVSIFLHFRSRRLGTQNFLLNNTWQTRLRLINLLLNPFFRSLYNIYFHPLLCVVPPCMLFRTITIEIGHPLKLHFRQWRSHFLGQIWQSRKSFLTMIFFGLTFVTYWRITSVPNRGGLIKMII